MHSGDSFGEQALFGNCVRGATVKAQNDNVHILSLSRDDITTILGDKIQVSLERVIISLVHNIHQYAEMGI